MTRYAEREKVVKAAFKCSTVVKRFVLWWCCCCCCCLWLCFSRRLSRSIYFFARREAVRRVLLTASSLSRSRPTAARSGVASRDVTRQRHARFVAPLLSLPLDFAVFFSILEFSNLWKTQPLNLTNIVFPVEWHFYSSCWTWILAQTRTNLRIMLLISSKCPSFDL